MGFQRSPLIVYSLLSCYSPNSGAVGFCRICFFLCASRSFPLLTDGSAFSVSLASPSSIYFHRYLLSSSLFVFGHLLMACFWFQPLYFFSSLYPPIVNIWSNIQRPLAFCLSPYGFVMFVFCTASLPCASGISHRICFYRCLLAGVSLYLAICSLCVLLFLTCDIFSTTFLFMMLYDAHLIPKSCGVTHAPICNTKFRVLHVGRWLTTDIRCR